LAAGTSRVNRVAPPLGELPEGELVAVSRGRPNWPNRLRDVPDLRRKNLAASGIKRWLPRDCSNAV